MDFSLPKVATGILGKVVDKVADTVKEGVENVKDGGEAIAGGVAAIGEAISDAAGAMADDDVRIEAQIGSYGTGKGGSGARTRSSLTL